MRRCRGRPGGSTRGKEGSEEGKVGGGGGGGGDLHGRGKEDLHSETGDKSMRAHKLLLL